MKIKVKVPKEFKKSWVLGIWIENEEVIEIPEALKADFLALGFKPVLTEEKPKKVKNDG